MRKKSLIVVGLDQEKNWNVANQGKIDNAFQAVRQFGDVVALDLSSVATVNTEALAFLLTCVKTASEKRVSLALCNLAPEVRLAVQVLGLHHKVQIFNTAEEAERAFDVRQVARVTAKAGESYEKATARESRHWSRPRPRIPSVAEALPQDPQ